MMVPLDHQNVGLTPSFGKRRPHADKNHAQMSICLQGKRFPLLAYFVNFVHRQTAYSGAPLLLASDELDILCVDTLLQLETIQLKYATKKNRCIINQCITKKRVLFSPF